ncbi:MAG TPA: hypothetical protein PK886_02145 [Candidatus Paceibacterota bacterium]|nr:hypothetical protein [Candidatus Paceibacterota bacterium]
MFKPTPTSEEIEALWEQVRQARYIIEIFIENNTEAFYEEMLLRFPDIMSSLKSEPPGTLSQKKAA